MLSEKALADLARQYLLADAVIDRNARTIDRRAGRAAARARTGDHWGRCRSVGCRVGRRAVVEPFYDEKNEEWVLLLKRTHNNNRTSQTVPRPTSRQR